MDFKGWMEETGAFDQKRDYKKRRPGAVTGAAKLARRGGGIASAVKPANLSRPGTENPAGQVYKGLTISGPEYRAWSKIHDPFGKKTKYLQDPYSWTTVESTGPPTQINWILQANPDFSSQGTTHSFQIEQRPLSNLRPHESPSRYRVTKILRMMRAGEQIPLISVGEDGMILDGHARYLAALKLLGNPSAVIPVEVKTARRT